MIGWMTVATGCKWTAVHQPWLNDQRSTAADVYSVLSDHLKTTIRYAHQ